jgi:hypothetical protein
VDSHPEKRMKAAYDVYEIENLPKLKQEHPSLRLSQLKQNSLPEVKDSDEEDN